MMNRSQFAARLLAAALVSQLVLQVRAQAPPATKVVESPTFREFNQRVKEYVHLQKSVPRLKSTKDRKEIEAGRLALVQQIDRKSVV